MTGSIIYTETTARPEQNIRCLANGAIDYAFYDALARQHRGIAFRATGRALSAVFRRLIGFAKPLRPADTPNGLAPTRPLPQRARNGRAKAGAARRSFSKAA